MSVRRLPLLTDGQARGEQCAWCRVTFSPATPSTPITGTTVRACPPPRPCAGQLEAVPR